MDPHRIQPFAHPPPTAGNSNNQPPPQAFGIQAPSFHTGEFARGPYYGAGAPPYPPGGYPYHNGFWEGGHPGGYPGPYPSGASSRRDEGSGRRLSDRISGFAPTEGGTSIVAGAAGLPPKPRLAALDSALTSGSGPKRANRTGSMSAGGVPPPPPPDAKEDPRAAAGKRISYHDMDLVAEVRY